MKRAITIIAIVVVIIGVAVALYFFFFNTSASLTGESPSVSNPFDSTGGTDVGTGGEVPTSDVPAPSPSASLPRLVKVSPGPVAAGAVAFNVFDTMTIPGETATATPTTATTTDVEVRYAARASGNVFSYRVGTGVNTRISNKTIPGVEEASWLPDGSIGFLRFLSSDQDKSVHIETYALPVGSDAAGYFLPRDLSEALPASNGNMFTLLPSTSGSIGSVGKPDGANTATLFSTPLTNITVSEGSGTYVAATKPSALMRGYAFLVSGGRFVEISGPETGLETLISPKGGTMLVSTVDGAGMHLSAEDIATRGLTPLPINTLAEKCAWTADGAAAYCAVPIATPSTNLPDDWHQGLVSFSDRIWKVDFATRVATLALDLPVAAGTDVDATNLALDPAGKALVFTNRIDGSLWVYSL